VDDAPLPLGGASGDRSVRPFSLSSVEPCTSPTVRTVVTWTVSTHVAVVPLVSVLVTLTAYEPSGRPPSAWTSAVALPPGAVAGETAVRVMQPAAGAGATPLMARSTIVSSGSVAVTVRVAALPAGVTSGTPQVSTAGAATGPPSMVWVPSPSKVSVAKPSHSVAGSKASPGFGSPAFTVDLRRIVLSNVLVRPVPHSVPGSVPRTPIESITTPALRSRTASLPLNQPEPLVWSAWAKIAAPAVACATT
jgi:hypothetical protein